MFREGRASVDGNPIRRVRWWWATAHRRLALGLLLSLSSLAAEASGWLDRRVHDTGSVEFVEPDGSTWSAQSDAWLERLVEQLEPLPQTPDGQWPLVLWWMPEGLSGDPDAVSRLLERGIVPTVRLDDSAIDSALLIDSLGAPVIALQAAGGDWPYTLNGVPGRLHDPLDLGGWRAYADRLRGVLGRFRERGIQLDAAWLDFENAPVNLAWPESSRFSYDRLPARALADAESFRVFTRRLWNGLLSAYVAAPLREFYPDISVTNWTTSMSTAAMPVLDWYNRPHPTSGSGLFTATNPIAYGHDIAFMYNRPAAGIRDQRDVDAVYTHVLLRQVSADAAGRRAAGGDLAAVAWVARWVRDIPGYSVPAMSRAAYREALRHLWLRGIDAIQVFNPNRPGHGEAMLAEVVDAARVYAEMLPHASIRRHGRVLNLEVPPAAGGALWSGVQLGEVAVLRVAGGDEPVTVEAWPGCAIVIPPSPRGRTLRLDRAGERVQVRPEEGGDYALVCSSAGL